MVPALVSRRRFRRHLQTLPEDVLFLIYTNLSFVDVLSLKQVSSEHHGMAVNA
jgi:hypothetical protein